jgi:Holliday junction DNA helicase RuvA
MNDDVARLTHVPGIGRKTAERLIVELRDRLANEPATAPVEASAAPTERDPPAEAVSALIALGYKPPEASRAVRAVPSQGLSTEEIIRQALRAMAV